MFRITSIPVYLQLTSSIKSLWKPYYRATPQKLCPIFYQIRIIIQMCSLKRDPMGPKQTISKNQNTDKYLQSQYFIMYKYAL